MEAQGGDEVSEFKLGQPVLFRSFCGDPWTPGHYGYQDGESGRHVMFGGQLGTYCLPLEGNEALAGHTGMSLEELDLPECGETFEYLEPVECLDRNSQTWVVGHYAKCERGADGEVLYHKVLIQGKGDTEWFDSSCIRKLKAEEGND